ncbi:hypothetical protein [Flavobacterium sp.]|uniref:hypothetical protein n=1 Tax=Flavobacterium sp. TaxID=239 RepID=UPI002616F5D7|nr:hypothetical protein [Flavobacterium sp.]
MKNQAEKSHVTNGATTIWNGFTFVYTALGAAIGIGLVLHILNTGVQQIPTWVLIVTAILLGISAQMSKESGNYTGTIAGGISLFGILFMMWFNPYLPIESGNSPLDQMMIRMISGLPYFPILAGIISIISSLCHTEKTV